MVKAQGDGAFSETPEFWSFTSAYRGYTPLMLAAAVDLPRAAKALLDQTADPYVRREVLMQ